MGNWLVSAAVFTISVSPCGAHFEVLRILKRWKGQRAEWGCGVIAHFDISGIAEKWNWGGALNFELLNR